jgi:flagellar biosynthesis/type III secretory pathway protein FliH
MLQAREQAGYERGRTEGERALSEQLMRQRGEVLEVQNGLLSALRNSLTEVRSQCERELVGLALEAAAKLVAGLPISGPMVEAAISEALAQVEEHTDYHIYLHPEDVELLQQINSPLLLPTVAGQKIHFHRAPEMSRGDCMVKTRFGLIDATRETKLVLMRKAVLA